MHDSLSVLKGVEGASSTQRKIAHQQFRSMVAHYPVRLMLETLGVLLWYAISGHYRHDVWPPAWTVLALCMIAVAAVGVLVFFKSQPAGSELRKWELRLAYWNVFMGFVWGVSCFTAAQDLIALPFIALGSLLVIVSALGLHAVYRPAMTWMVLPCSVLTFIYILSWGGWGGIASAIGFVTLVLLLYRIVRANNSAMTRAMLAAEDRLDLLHALDTQRHLAHEANVAKTSFLASVSHDLRQPIHSIALLLHTMLPKQQETSLLVEQVSDVLEKMQRLLHKAHGETNESSNQDVPTPNLRAKATFDLAVQAASHEKQPIAQTLWCCVRDMASPWMRKSDLFLCSESPGAYAHLYREQFKTMYDKAAAGTWQQLVLTLVLAVIVLNLAPSLTAVLWVLCGVLIAGWMGFTAYRYAPDRTMNKEMRSIERVYGRLATLQGLWWGCFWWLLPHAIAIWYAPYVAAAMLVAIVVDLQIAVHYRPALFWRSVPCIALITCGFVTSGAYFLVIHGLIFCAVGCFIVRCGWLQNALMTQILQLNQERAKLTVDLESQRAAAQHAHEVKTRLLTTVSRDLQEPMHSMAALLDSLRLHASNPTELLAQMSASMEATESMLQALSEVSQIDSGSLPLQQETLALDVLLRRIELQFSAQAVSKGLRLNIMPCALRVRSDAFQLQRIVANLVANAIRYTVQGHIVVRCRLRRSVLWLQVWDSGVGIARENRQRIFEEFVQLSTLPSQQACGLGLGLSIVQKLAQRLDHPLQLRSRWGRGSVFAVGLPCVDTFEAKPMLEKEHAALLHLLANKLVLLIDSDITSLHDMQSRLQAYRCAVLVASSTAQALAQVEQTLRTPDLILSDYSLGPTDTGLECITQVRAAVGEHIPALLMMAERPPRLESVRQLGGPVLGKPVPLQDLLASLQRLQALTSDLIP